MRRSDDDPKGQSCYESSRYCLWPLECSPQYPMTTNEGSHEGIYPQISTFGHFPGIVHGPYPKYGRHHNTDSRQESESVQNGRNGPGG